MKQVYQGAHYQLLYDDQHRDGVVDEIVCGRVPFFDAFLQPVYDTWVGPGSVVVEVGAHAGTHTLYLSKLAGVAGRVIAFEPQLGLFLHLCANLWHNDCHNVEPHRTALFCTNGPIKPNVYPDTYWERADKAGISFSPTGNPADFGTVEGRTLDSYGLDTVGFIKIDAETNDLNVARGGMETIARCRPVIAFEEGGGNWQPWQELLGPLGYTVTQLAQSNYLAMPARRA